MAPTKFQLKPEFRPLTADDIDFLIGVGRREAELLDQLQERLEQNDERGALVIARELCGLEKKIRE
jgi:hypothetical protein